MGNKQAVVAIETQANQLDTRLGTLEKSVTTLQGTIKDLQGSVDNHKTVIDQQRTVIDQQKTEIEKTRTNIAGLQRVADELAVLRVVNQLATDINGRDFKSARELFDEFIDYDEYVITQEAPRSKLAGDDLVDNLRRSEGVYKGINWVVTNPQVTVNGDEATVICQFRANHFQAHNEKGADYLENQGTFRQTLVRNQGVWRIKVWKFTSLAQQSGNPRLHDIAAKYAAQYGPPAAPTPRGSTQHFAVGVALVVPGKSAGDLRQTGGPEKKKEETKVEIEKVALKKTEPVKKEEPKKMEIPKARLASSSVNKKDETAPLLSPTSATSAPADTPLSPSSSNPAIASSATETPAVPADVPAPAPTADTPAAEVTPAAAAEATPGPAVELAAVTVSDTPATDSS